MCPSIKLDLPPQPQLMHLAKSLPRLWWALLNAPRVIRTTSSVETILLECFPPLDREVLKDRIKPFYLRFPSTVLNIALTFLGLSLLI